MKGKIHSIPWGPKKEDINCFSLKEEYNHETVSIEIKKKNIYSFTNSSICLGCQKLISHKIFLMDFSLYIE